jgi:hypothetical protein
MQIFYVEFFDFWAINSADALYSEILLFFLDFFLFLYTILLVSCEAKQWAVAEIK